MISNTTWMLLSHFVILAISVFIISRMSKTIDDYIFHICSFFFMFLFLDWIIVNIVTGCALLHFFVIPRDGCSGIIVFVFAIIGLGQIIMLLIISPIILLFSSIGILNFLDNKK